MAWIELHQAVWTHRKTFELAAHLELDETYAAAHLIRFWTWALDNAPSGDVSGTSHRAIAYGAGWRGDADQFVEALIAAGWLDDDLAIHDWDDYAGRLVERREANAERMRQARAARRGQPRHETPPPQPPLPIESEDESQHVESTCDERVPDVQGLPDRTGPNPTGPDRTGPPPQTPPATEREGPGALPRAAPSEKTTRRRSLDSNGSAPAAVAHGPPGHRTNGATRREGPVLNGRNGWDGCPAGCPTNHGGPQAARHLRDDWLAIPTDDRPSWQAFLASHGRPDLADVPAPTPAQQEA